MKEAGTNKATSVQKATRKDVDAAFDALAKFLFDMYRKQKEASETEISNE